MRLPAWEHLPMPLRPPLHHPTVADLLERIVVGQLDVADRLGAGPSDRAALPDRPTDAVIEAVRTGLRALPPGPVPDVAASAVRTAVAEAVVLGWDLQQAVMAGADPDDILVADVLPWLWAGTVQVWPGLPGAEAPAEADATARMLWAAGRHGPDPASATGGPVSP